MSFGGTSLVACANVCVAKLHRLSTRTPNEYRQRTIIATSTRTAHSSDVTETPGGHDSFRSSAQRGVRDSNRATLRNCMTTQELREAHAADRQERHRRGEFETL
jgi:hypothetical protein